MKRSTVIAVTILAGCILAAVALVVVALAFSMGRASVAAPAGQTSPQPPAVRSDPRCAPLLAGDEGVVSSAHGASWTSFASGAVTGVVAIPVYVTRAFDPQADGYMEVIAADPDSGSSFAMIAPASAVDGRVLRGGHAVLLAVAPAARATESHGAPILACGIVPR